MAMRGLDIGFLLDCQWHTLRGQMETTKRPALVTLARVLAATGTPYAIIGGVALQIHQADPRTTLDIDWLFRVWMRSLALSCGWRDSARPVASPTRRTGSGRKPCRSSLRTTRRLLPRWGERSRLN